MPQHATTLQSNLCMSRANTTHWQIVLEPALTVFCSCPTGRTGPSLHTHSVSQSLDMDPVSLIHRALAGSTTSTYKGSGPCTIHQTPSGTVCHPPTIRVYLAAVSFLHHVGGHRSPVSGKTFLKLVLRGIQKKQKQSQCRTPRLPITPLILADSLEHFGCDPSQDRLMPKAAMSLTFFGFLRVSGLMVPAYHTSCQFLARRPHRTC